MSSLAGASPPKARRAATGRHRIVLEMMNPSALEIAMPEVLGVALDLATARKIGQARELSLGFLEYAAKHGYSSAPSSRLWPPSLTQGAFR